MAVHPKTFALAAVGLLAIGCSRSKAPAPVAAASPQPPAVAPAPAEPSHPSAREEEPTAKATDADRVATLVAQLGSTDYATREAASKSLAAMGKGVIPALEKAAKDPDVERSSRAKDLIALLGAAEEDAKSPDIPGLAGTLRASGGTPQITPDGGGVRVGVQLVAVAGGGNAGGVRTRTEMSGNEIKRTVENDNGSAAVTEGKSGFSLTLTPKGGEAKTYSAASREEFKKKYPKTYAKYFGN